MMKTTHFQLIIVISIVRVEDRQKKQKENQTR